MDLRRPESLVDRWADWDRFPGERPFARPEADAVLTGLDRQSLVMLRGARGVGKTTLLKAVAERLVQRGLRRDQILFIDLEDPVWAPQADSQDLDRLLAKAGPVRVVLLDGVERLPAWVDWARSLRARRRLMVLAAQTGAVGTDSPAGVLGLDCLPLSFSRWVKIYTDKKVDRHQVSSLLPRYLEAGGLPVPRKAEGRSQALLELFFSALMKDVILLQPVRNTNILTAVSVYAIGRSGRPISASRLKGEFTRSVDQARMFLAHLEAAGLVSLVKRLEDAGRSSQAARLCFAYDTGMAWALGHHLRQNQQSSDPRLDPHLALTAVYHQLLRSGRQCWAWRQQGRHGLACGAPNQPDLLVDVQTDGPQGPDLGPLAAVMEQTGCPNGLLLNAGEESDASPALAGEGVIEIRSLADFLLVEELTDMKVDNKSTDRKVNSYNGGLPPHLL